jgi:hypothetical protein
MHTVRLGISHNLALEFFTPFTERVGVANSSLMLDFPDESTLAPLHNPSLPTT